MTFLYNCHNIIYIYIYIYTVLALANIPSYINYTTSAITTRTSENFDGGMEFSTMDNIISNIELFISTYTIFNVDTINKNLSDYKELNFSGGIDKIKHKTIQDEPHLLRQILSERPTGSNDFIKNILSQLILYSILLSVLDDNNDNVNYYFIGLITLMKNNINPDELYTYIYDLVTHDLQIYVQTINNKYINLVDAYHTNDMQDFMDGKCKDRLCYITANEIRNNAINKTLQLNAVNIKRQSRPSLQEMTDLINAAEAAAQIGATIAATTAAITAATINAIIKNNKETILQLGYSIINMFLLSIENHEILNISGSDNSFKSTTCYINMLDYIQILNANHIDLRDIYN